MPLGRLRFTSASTQVGRSSAPDVHHKELTALVGLAAALGGAAGKRCAVDVAASSGNHG
jgi:hypothetical protein